MKSYLNSLFLLLFLIINLNSFSQLTMTRGEVYNYNVGDVFLTRHYVTGGFENNSINLSNLYEKTTVLSKSFSVSFDTVFYNCLVNTKYVHYVQEMFQAPYYSTSYSIDTTTLIFTDLNSPIQNYPFMSTPICCSDSVDSVYYDVDRYCSKKTWHKEFTWGEGCFEEPFPIYDYVEGCGGPYYSDGGGGGSPYTGHHKLIYYKKGIDSCGTNVSCTAGVDELSKLEFTISIFPNPTNSFTTINFSEQQKHTIIKIIDVHGKEIKIVNFTGSQFQIEKGELREGIYFVQIIDDKRNTMSRKIIIQ